MSISQEQQIISDVIQILGRFGLTASVVSTSRVVSPDLLAIGNGARFLIEIKTKEDDPSIIASELDAHNCGEIYEESVPIGRRNRHSGVLRKAIGQLSNAVENNSDFRLIWFECIGRNSDLHQRRIRATLYGLGHVIGQREGEEWDSRECLFMTHADFVTYADQIDGVFICWDGSVQLCVNSLSPRAEAFRGTSLTRGIAALGGLYDPDELERSDSVYIAEITDCRPSIGKAIGSVIRKYGLDGAMDLNLQRHSASVRVDCPQESS